MKNGVVLHVKTGLQRMQLAQAQQTELITFDELKQGLTDAMAEAKKVFLEELAHAVTLVAQEIVTALTKVTLTPTPCPTQQHTILDMWIHILNRIRMGQPKGSHKMRPLSLSSIPLPCSLFVYYSQVPVSPTLNRPQPQLQFQQQNY